TERPTILAALAEMLRNLHHETGEVGTLEEAINFARQAVTLSAADDSTRAYRLYSLGAALDELYVLRGDKGDMTAAIYAYRTAATIATAEVHARLAAGTAWGALAFRTGDPLKALEGYTIAIEMLPLLSWRSLPIADRTRPLRSHPGLADA